VEIPVLRLGSLFTAGCVIRFLWFDSPLYSKRCPGSISLYLHKSYSRIVNVISGTGEKKSGDETREKGVGLFAGVLLWKIRYILVQHCTG
jgi:hypothetical protein